MMSGYFRFAAKSNVTAFFEYPGESVPESTVSALFSKCKNPKTPRIMHFIALNQSSTNYGLWSIISQRKKFVKYNVTKKFTILNNFFHQFCFIPPNNTLFCQNRVLTFAFGIVIIYVHLSEIIGGTARDQRT